MVDLELVLSWMGLSRYIERFVQAGFDSWETVMEITEEDLGTLNVELGHRRKLQREIANSRRLAETANQDLDQPSSPWPLSPSDAPDVAQGKRGYVHHPRADPNAPERPYSAYVLFSKAVREDLKSQPLSFTNISKEVGERWQRLTPEEKHSWKSQGAIPREQYKADLAKYQQSENHRHYLQYLAEFRSAQAARRGDLPSHVNAAASSPMHRPKSSAAPPERTAPSSLRDQEMKDVGADGGHVPRAVNPGGPPSPHHRTRAVHACEPCRQRKVKCDGERPDCGKCRRLNLTCSFGASKRDGRTRTVDGLLRKVKAYETILRSLMSQVGDEDRATIETGLLTHFPSSQAPFKPKPTKPPGDPDGDPDGESDVSGIGSMGSTGHAHEEEFKGVKSGQKFQAFMGQSSEEKWIKRLEKELPDSPTDEWRFLQSHHSSSAHDGSSNPSPSGHADEVDAGIGNEIDPFSLPIRSTADRLVSVFFATIYPSFPIIHQTYFSNRYEECFPIAPIDEYKDHSFLVMLQIIFAIGAVHAHTVKAEWAGDERDHLLYFARARTLGVESGMLNESVYHEQVQIFGLAGMYFMATNQTNRAWSTIGLAIRSAQALGMHLSNATPMLSVAEKEFRVGIWYSIVSLERVITVMTGRPTMVKDEDCSVTIPLTDLEIIDSPITEPTGPSVVKVTGFANRPPRSNYSVRIFRRAEKAPNLPLNVPHPTAYFSYYAQLNAISQLVADELYHPTVRNSKWSDIQRKIQGLDEKLLQWAAALPNVFNIQAPSSSSVNESYRVALGILFSSTRMIINRPCLCRLDAEVSNQSGALRDSTRLSADRCVASAKGVLELIADEENLDRILTGPLWWMLPHHLKRATTILLLDLAYRLAERASEADKVVNYAKEAVHWLQKMAHFSEAAKNSWITLNHLLRLTIEKIGGDPSDFTQSTDPNPPAHSSDHSTEGMGGVGPTLFPGTAGMWQQPGGFEHGFHHLGTVFGDLSTLELDAFGLWQDPSVWDFYPRSIENAKNPEMGQEEEDLMMLNE